MKKILAATLVLGIAAMVANAAVTVTWTKTATVTLTVAPGVLKGIDVWTFSATSTGDPNQKISGYQLFLKGPAFQVLKAEDTDEDEVMDLFTKTPTLDGAAVLTTAQRNADTHFLNTNADYLSTPTAPDETNDHGLGTTGTNPQKWFGHGADTIDVGLAVDTQDRSFVGVCALNTEKQALTLSFFQLGMDAGTNILTAFAGSWGEVGAGPVTQKFYIPEPATLTLLGLGGLALIRRRR
jgi:MYXO-CTERM domain-containing protein